MLIKIAGAAIVMLATVLTGMYYGSMETYRVTDLQEMKKALSILNSEIEFALTPLPEALAHVAARTKGSVSKIFAFFGDKLTAGQKAGTAELWELSLKKFAGESYYGREDIEAFMSFGKTLGYLDKNMQAASILITTSYIDGAIARLNETRGKTQKLFGSLGVLSGLLVIVVLI